MKPLATAKRLRLVLVITLGLAGVGAWALPHLLPKSRLVTRETLGDIEVSHTRVSLNRQPERGLGRVGPGDRIKTDGSGRARLRLVDGVTALIDISTEVALAAGQLRLERGRVFIDCPEGQLLELGAGGLSAKLAGTKLSVAFEPAQSRHVLFVAQGEVVASTSSGQKRVQSGETLVISPSGVKVQPETAFDDWTSGLAVPWQSRKLSRSALPEVWAFTQEGEPEAQLHVSKETIEVSLDGEFATTRARTVYYNGRERSIVPDIRVALPPKAQLDAASITLSDTKVTQPARFGICATSQSPRSPHPGLEWAGGGWLVGKLPSVEPGQSVTLELSYSEWLDGGPGGVTYRQPFATGSESPIIGELFLSLDASRTHALELETNRGSIREGSRVTLQSADSRMTDDWVTRYVPQVVKDHRARAYLEEPADGSEPYVMVRLEPPTRPESKVRVAVVLDISESVGPAGLELGRTAIDALLQNLSAEDSAIVLAADDEVSLIGGKAPSPTTPAYRKQIGLELAKLRPGGASNLGVALERAADLLDGAADRKKFQNAVIYLGDGKPTLGELSVERIRGRLLRRSSGMPRLSAIAIGGSADLSQLARLASANGQVFRVAETTEAPIVAAKAIRVMAQPSFTSFQVDLGTPIDRVYPRTRVEVAAGETFTAVGRLKGTLPYSVKLTYLDEGEAKSLELPLHRLPRPEGADIGRRWAEQRVRELVSGEDALPLALRLAEAHHLLTPWSGWFFDNAVESNQYSCSGFERRLVELTMDYDVPYVSRLLPRVPPGSGFLEPSLSYDAETSIEQAVVLHARTLVDHSLPALVACRDTRLSRARALPRTLRYAFTVTPSGKAENSSVEPGDMEPVDLPLQRCAERVLKSQAFVGAERPVTVAGSIELPREPRNLKSQCSIASRLPLEARRSVWLSRQGPLVERFVQAQERCELPTWSDRKALLDLLGNLENSVPSRLALARSLEAAGQKEGADYLTRRTLDAIVSLEDLGEARRFLLDSEPNLDALIARRVERCRSDAERLSVLRKALLLAPHSPLGRRLLLLLLERMGDTGSLHRETEAIRRDPFADAGLITLAAGALRRTGQTNDARRTFSGLFERAPSDPWILAYAGDELRHAGLYDEAVAAYDSLSNKTPNDSSTLIRLALAQVGTGRVDIAARLLDRAGQIGGRSDDERIHELASLIRAVVLAQARESSRDADARTELERRLAETTLPDLSAVVLVEVGSSPEHQVTLAVTRDKDRSEGAPDLDAKAMGLYGLYVERGTQAITLKLSRKVIAGVARALPIKLQILALGGEGTSRRISLVTAEFKPDESSVVVVLDKEIVP